ncbi:MAG: phosphatidate cytidylyltransferase [Legionellales bacterium]
MFIQRLITLLILIPLVVLGIFYANHGLLLGVVVLITLAAGSEYWQLIPISNALMKAVFMVLLLLSVWACGCLFSYWQAVGLVLWVFVCIAVLTFPKSQNYWGYPTVVAGVSLLLFPLFVQSLIHLYFLPQGKSLLIYVLCLIWAADVGAYVAGKLWGKHKLIPEVSPGKSWEGGLGGFLLAMTVAAAGYMYYTPHFVFIWFVLAVTTVLISIFGDLFISILKRRCHVKDTGSVIPGHGGILDRLDSLIAALPVFYFGYSFF